MAAIEQSVLLIALDVDVAILNAIRMELDPSHRRGVPAHVTILFPFVEPSMFNELQRERLRDLFERFEPFNYQLNSIRWFDQTVIWLAPEPANLFIELTNAVMSAFPNFPPEHEVVVPHLTLGIDHSVERLTTAAELLRAELPISAKALEVLLMTTGGSGSFWTVAERFPLGRASD